MKNDELFADFQKFLEETPALGLEHPVGRKLRTAIRHFPKSALAGRIWYRARKPKAGQVFTRSSQLAAPDPNKVSVGQGRFSAFGQSIWYLADEADHAVVEVLQRGTGSAFVMGWSVPPLDGVLDLVPSELAAPVLSSTPILAVAMMYGNALRQVPANRNRQPEYLIPQFVMNLAKRAGFQAIRNLSARHFGHNLQVFDRFAPLVPAGRPYRLKLPYHVWSDSSRIFISR